MYQQQKHQRKGHLSARSLSFSFKLISNLPQISERLAKAIIKQDPDQPINERANTLTWCYTDCTLLQAVDEQIYEY